MAAHDIVITKPGGLTVAEALALGKPLILCQPAPGVETANLEFLARQGVALPGRTAGEAIRSLEVFIHDSDRVKNMQTRAFSLGFPNSAQVVVDLILDAEVE